MAASPELSSAHYKAKELLSRLAAITTATAPEAIREIISALRGVGRQAEALPGGEGIAATARAYAQEAQADLDKQAREQEEEYAAQSRILHHYVETQEHRVTSMVDSMIKLNMLTVQEQAYFAAIKDNADYGVTRFDENGNPLAAEENIKGIQLRRDAALLKAYANRYELREKDLHAWQQMNLELYGHEDGPHNEAEVKEGRQKLAQALKNVHGEAASRKETHEEKKEIGEKLRKDVDHLHKHGELPEKHLLPDSHPIPTKDRAKAQDPITQEDVLQSKSALEADKFMDDLLELSGMEINEKQAVADKQVAYVPDAVEIKKGDFPIAYTGPALPGKRGAASPIHTSSAAALRL